MDFPVNHEVIQNFGGIEALYLKHLHKFQNNCHNYTCSICHHIDFHEYEEAKRITHSLRGLTATLGLSAIVENTSVIELALKEGRYDDLPSLLASLNSSINQTF